MEKSKLTPKIVDTIKKEYKQLGSIRATAEKVSEKVRKKITFHNVRDVLKDGGLFSDFKISDAGRAKETEPKEIEELSTFLKERNISIKDLSNIFYEKELNETTNFKILDGKEEFEFGVVADTHLGAKTCAIEELHHFYKTCKEKGIKDILHAGDLTDGGGKVYSGHLSELKVFGIDDMLEYVKTHYPKQDGITTHFILGNHDEDFLKHGGANIGKAISTARSDMNYLGFYDANVVINGIKIGLHHGAGGASYAQSYKIQKYVENLTGEQKPQIYVLGHYHGSLFMSIRNIHSLIPACFQKPNNFSTRLGLPNIIGGYIVKVTKTDKNEVRAITATFYPYYSK